MSRPDQQLSSLRTAAYVRMSVIGLLPHEKTREYGGRAWIPCCCVARTLTAEEYLFGGMASGRSLRLTPLNSKLNPEGRLYSAIWIQYKELAEGGGIEPPRFPGLRVQAALLTFSGALRGGLGES